MLIFNTKNMDEERKVAPKRKELSYDDNGDANTNKAMKVNSTNGFAAPRICKKYKFAESLPVKKVKNESKYDKTLIVGFYNVKGESNELRDYIDYGFNTLVDKYQRKKHPCSSEIYEIENNVYPDLSDLTENSRLIVIGHSGTNEFGNIEFSGMEHDHLIEALFEDCDLKQAKVIKFISCSIASGTFLTDLKADMVDLTLDKLPRLHGYTKPLKMSYNGEICVDLGEEQGIVSAKPYKIRF